MNKLLCVATLLSLSPLSALAGSTAAAAIRPGPSAVAPSVSQTAASGAGLAGAPSQAAPGLPQAPGQGATFASLPGAYKAALANGATPADDGTVQVTLNGVTLTVDREDNVVSR